MSKGSQRVPFVQKQEELDEFGQNRLTERSGLLYNIDGWGGYGKTYGFLHFPFWEKMKHQFRSWLTPLHSTMFHLLHRTTSKSKGVVRMLEPMMPEYSNTMYLKGFSATQVYSAFKQTQRRKQNDKRKKKREQSILEKETMAFIEAMLSAMVEKSMKEIFNDWK